MVTIFLLPLMTWKQNRTLRDDVRRDLAAAEETLKNQQSIRSGNIVGVVNQLTEDVTQIREKLKKGKLSDAEIRDMIASLKEIIRMIKSILNSICSFVGEEKKSEWQV